MVGRKAHQSEPWKGVHLVKHEGQGRTNGCGHQSWRSRCCQASRGPLSFIKEILADHQVFSMPKDGSMLL
jgi:hypothetical protein